jgi:O-antigen/teichoic acid export membrane protein
LPHLTKQCGKGYSWFRAKANINEDFSGTNRKINKPKLTPLKKLAGQTVIYGIPSIAGRFLNYLLTYLYTRVFTTGEFGVNSEFYAYSGVFTVLLAFGLETGYFRFAKDAENPKKVFSTALGFIMVGASVFLGLLMLFAQPMADLLKYPDNPEYIRWFALMLAFDAIGAIPFARLRYESKAKNFAGIKIIEIAINIGLNIFFLIVCRKAHINNPTSFLGSLYNPAIGVGYVFIINVFASAVKLLLLSPQLKDITEGFDKELFNKMIRYSLPMVLIGFAGIINEMLDRMILKYTLPYDNATNLAQLGIYAACYKLAVIMSLFIQAFRYAAEPFFFSHAAKDDSRKVYADVMQYFVIFCVFIFVGVMLYMDKVQTFIGPDFRVGLKVVPILLIANLFFGIYTNLSIWYKLTDRTMTGAWVSIGGAVVTIGINLLFIPAYGYMASAWATLICYVGMAAVSYFLGQKYFPVNYPVIKVLAYVAAGIIVWQLFVYTNQWLNVSANSYVTLAISTFYMLLFTAGVFIADGRDWLAKVKRS